MQNSIKTIISMLLLFSSHVVFAKAEVDFSGSLVEEPCTLSPDDTNLTVDFGTVILKSLYNEKRSLPHMFTLHLKDCDISLGNSVQVLFTGTEAADQPGLLAINSSDTAKGVALGLETLKGEQVLINKPSPSHEVYDGTNTLHFAAFVQASEQAISNHTIVPGDFSAVATFEFIYD